MLKFILHWYGMFVFYVIQHWDLKDNITASFCYSIHPHNNRWSFLPLINFINLYAANSLRFVFLNLQCRVKSWLCSQFFFSLICFYPSCGNSRSFSTTLKCWGFCPEQWRFHILKYDLSRFFTCRVSSQWETNWLKKQTRTREEQRDRNQTNPAHGVK